MATPARLAAIAEACDAARFAEMKGELAELGEPAASLGATIATVFPAMAGVVRLRRSAVAALAREGFRKERTRIELIRRLRAACGFSAQSSPPTLLAVRRGLRLQTAIERLRIALREIDPDVDVDVTAREWTDLADAQLEVALEEARGAVEARDGAIRSANGARNGFTVIGLGKLGGLELNAGSDIDLMFVHELDEGAPDGPSPFDAFTRIARRVVATIDEHDEDGFVARIDLRLRPEGASGPMTNSIAAAVGYYESFGRAWERAALLRARAVAGDVAVGNELLAELSPFVFRKSVEPRIALDMIDMVERSRAELSTDAARDLKLGSGGIREAEFFVQTLQLIWGGRDSAVRAANTFAGLRRLRARGYVTEREVRDVGDALMLLRRVEHHVQLSTGVQTHLLPDDSQGRGRLARGLGFRGENELMAALAKARARVAERFSSLAPTKLHRRSDDEAERLLLRIDPAVQAPVTSSGHEITSPTAEEPSDLLVALRALARRPDAPLGHRVRERHPAFASALVRAISEAADPEQAATLVRSFFERLSAPGVEAYVRALASQHATGAFDQRPLMRLVGLCGTSAYLGGSLAGRLELADRLLFSAHPATSDPAQSRALVVEEVSRLSASEADDAELFVGALRRAKSARELEIGLLDLGGEIDVRAVGAALAATADAILEETTAFCLREAARRLRLDAPLDGLSILGLGKLGGEDLGYGADLDVLFVYDASSFAARGLDPSDAPEIYTRAAARIMRLLSTPHEAGAGYELDARLRPSGSQGALVVSRDSFRVYHLQPDAPGPHAADWERQALVRLRACAGDRVLGESVVAIAHEAAYAEGPFTRGAERRAAFVGALVEQRLRLQNEVARERPGRYDPKLGRGGLLDVEFAVQLLQLSHGRQHAELRTPDTLRALDALEVLGILRSADAAVLRDGFGFLRRLEQRIRVIHGGRAALIEEGAPGLSVLARSLGLRSRVSAKATEQLMTRYREVTAANREVFDRITTAAGAPAPM